MYTCTWDNYTFIPLQKWLILVARLPSAIFEDGGYAAPPPQQCKAFPPGTLTREHRSDPGSDYSAGFNPPDSLSRIGFASWLSQQEAGSYFAVVETGQHSAVLAGLSLQDRFLDSEVQLLQLDGLADVTGIGHNARHRVTDEGFRLVPGLAVSYQGHPPGVHLVGVDYGKGQNPTLRILPADSRRQMAVTGAW